MATKLMVRYSHYIIRMSRKVGNHMEKLSREFYRRDALTLAKELLGKVLVNETGGERLATKIVETEAYMGPDDKAAHFYGGKRTPRTDVIYGDGGFAYIYLIYGMYHCFNIVTGVKNEPQAVLIRAVEPLEGFDSMAQNRFKLPYKELLQKQVLGLTNGPGKLCLALDLDKSLNKQDLCSDRLYVEDGGIFKDTIVHSKRVGIDYAEEAKDFPWRFYIEGNSYVSLK